MDQVSRNTVCDGGSDTAPAKAENPRLLCMVTEKLCSGIGALDW
jgi:hypothetical protein